MKVICSVVKWLSSFSFVFYYLSALLFNILNVHIRGDYTTMSIVLHSIACNTMPSARRGGHKILHRRAVVFRVLSTATHGGGWNTVSMGTFHLATGVPEDFSVVAIIVSIATSGGVYNTTAIATPSGL